MRLTCFFFVGKGFFVFQPFFIHSFTCPKPPNWGPGQIRFVIINTSRSEWRSFWTISVALQEIRVDTRGTIFSCEGSRADRTIPAQSLHKHENFGRLKKAHIGPSSVPACMCTQKTASNSGNLNKKSHAPTREHWPLHSPYFEGRTTVIGPEIAETQQYPHLVRTRPCCLAFGPNQRFISHVGQNAF